MIDMTEFADNSLPQRLFPIIKELSEKANAYESAEVEQFKLDVIQTLSDHADSIDGVTSLANQAMGLLAGANNYYSGEKTFSGTANLTYFSSPSNVVGENISLDGNNIFQFGHLGDYHLHVDISGAMENTRNDWYQVIFAEAYNAVNGEIIPIYYQQIPPLYTIGVQGGNMPTLVKVNLGDQWKIRWNWTAGGIMQSGAKCRVKWSKVV